MTSRDARVAKMSLTSKKRPASGEDEADQPRKKEKLEEEEKKPPKQPFNPLPTPPTHLRPPPQLVIFGNGDSNQFGLGPDTFGDIVRPRLHAWVDQAVKDGIFGDLGAGIESVSAGGMHTLMIDEAGKVSSILCIYSFYTVSLGMVLGKQRQRFIRSYN